MFKRVDLEDDEHEFEGYSYVNQRGNTEFVILRDVSVVEILTDGETVAVYVEDIPKLIKALQAAYGYKSVQDDF